MAGSSSQVSKLSSKAKKQISRHKIMFILFNCLPGLPSSLRIKKNNHSDRHKLSARQIWHQEAGKYSGERSTLLWSTIRQGLCAAFSAFSLFNSPRKQHLSFGELERKDFRVLENCSYTVYSAVLYHWHTIRHSKDFWVQSRPRGTGTVRSINERRTN